MQDIRDITVQVTDAALRAVDADALVLNWFKDEKDSLPPEWADLDAALNGALSEALAGDTFKGETYESEIRAGGEVLLARIEPDARLAPGDAVHFRLDPAHGLLVAR